MPFHGSRWRSPPDAWPGATVAEEDVVPDVVAEHERAHEVLAHHDVDQVDTLLGGHVRIEPSGRATFSSKIASDFSWFTFTRPPR